MRRYNRWMLVWLAGIFLITTLVPAPGFAYSSAFSGGISVPVGIELSRDEYTLYFPKELSQSQNRLKETFEVFLRLPPDLIWANLSPGYPPLPPELVGTYLGYSLLLTDLQFKEDVKRAVLKRAVFFEGDGFSDFPFFWIEPSRVVIGRDPHHPEKAFVSQVKVRVRVKTTNRRLKAFYDGVCRDIESAIMSAYRYRSFREAMALYALALYVKKQYRSEEKKAQKRERGKEKDKILPGIEFLSLDLYEKSSGLFSPYWIKSRYVDKFFARVDLGLESGLRIVGVGGIRFKKVFVWIRKKVFPSGLFPGEKGRVKVESPHQAKQIPLWLKGEIKKEGLSSSRYVLSEEFVSPSGRRSVVLYDWDREESLLIEEDRGVIERKKGLPLNLYLRFTPNIELDERFAKRLGRAVYFAYQRGILVDDRTLLISSWFPLRFSYLQTKDTSTTRSELLLMAARLGKKLDEISRGKGLAAEFLGTFFEEGVFGERELRFLARYGFKNLNFRKRAKSSNYFKGIQTKVVAFLEDWGQIVVGASFLGTFLLFPSLSIGLKFGGLKFAPLVLGGMKVKKKKKKKKEKKKTISSSFAFNAGFPSVSVFLDSLEGKGKRANDLLSKVTGWKENDLGQLFPYTLKLKRVPSNLTDTKTVSLYLKKFLLYYWDRKGKIWDRLTPVQQTLLLNGLFSSLAAYRWDDLLLTDEDAVDLVRSATNFLVKVLALVSDVSEDERVIYDEIVSLVPLLSKFKEFCDELNDPEMKVELAWSVVLVLRIAKKSNCRESAVYDAILSVFDLPEMTKEQIVLSPYPGKILTTKKVSNFLRFTEEEKDSLSSFTRGQYLTMKLLRNRKIESSEREELISLIEKHPKLLKDLFSLVHENLREEISLRKSMKEIMAGILKDGYPRFVYDADLLDYFVLVDLEVRGATGLLGKFWTEKRFGEEDLFRLTELVDRTLFVSKPIFVREVILTLFLMRDWNALLNFTRQHLEEGNAFVNWMYALSLLHLGRQKDFEGFLSARPELYRMITRRLEGIKQNRPLPDAVTLLLLAGTTQVGSLFSRTILAHFPRSVKGKDLDLVELMAYYEFVDILFNRVTRDRQLPKQRLKEIVELIYPVFSRSNSPLLLRLVYLYLLELVFLTEDRDLIRSFEESLDRLEGVGEDLRPILSLKKRYLKEWIGDVFSREELGENKAVEKSLSTLWEVMRTTYFLERIVLSSKFSRYKGEFYQRLSRLRSISFQGEESEQVKIYWDILDLLFSLREKGPVDSVRERFKVLSSLMTSYLLGEGSSIEDLWNYLDRCSQSGYVLSYKEEIFALMYVDLNFETNKQRFWDRITILSRVTSVYPIFQWALMRLAVDRLDNAYDRERFTELQRELWGRLLRVGLAGYVRESKELRSKSDSKSSLKALWNRLDDDYQTLLYCLSAIGLSSRWKAKHIVSLIEEAVKEDLDSLKGELGEVYSHLKEMFREEGKVYYELGDYFRALRELEKRTFVSDREINPDVVRCLKEARRWYQFAKRVIPMFDESWFSLWEDGEKGKVLNKVILKFYKNGKVIKESKVPIGFPLVLFQYSKPLPVKDIERASWIEVDLDKFTDLTKKERDWLGRFLSGLRDYLGVWQEILPVSEVTVYCAPEVYEIWNSWEGNSTSIDKKEKEKGETLRPAPTLPSDFIGSEVLRNLDLLKWDTETESWVASEFLVEFLRAQTDISNLKESLRILFEDNGKFRFIKSYPKMFPKEIKVRSEDLLGVVPCPPSARLRYRWVAVLLTPHPEGGNRYVPRMILTYRRREVFSEAGLPLKAVDRQSPNACLSPLHLGGVFGRGKRLLDENSKFVKFEEVVGKFATNFTIYHFESNEEGQIGFFNWSPGYIAKDKGLFFAFFPLTLDQNRLSQFVLSPEDWEKRAKIGLSPEAIVPMLVDYKDKAFLVGYPVSMSLFRAKARVYSLIDTMLGFAKVSNVPKSWWRNYVWIRRYVIGDSPKERTFSFSMSLGGKRTLLFIPRDAVIVIGKRRIRFPRKLFLEFVFSEKDFLIRFFEAKEKSLHAFAEEIARLERVQFPLEQVKGGKYLFSLRVVPSEGTMQLFSESGEEGKVVRNVDFSKASFSLKRIFPENVMTVSEFGFKEVTLSKNREFKFATALPAGGKTSISVTLPKVSLWGKPLLPSRYKNVKATLYYSSDGFVVKRMEIWVKERGKRRDLFAIDFMFYKDQVSYSISLPEQGSGDVAYIPEIDRYVIVDKRIKAEGGKVDLANLLLQDLDLSSSDWEKNLSTLLNLEVFSPSEDIDNLKKNYRLLVAKMAWGGILYLVRKEDERIEKTIRFYRREDSVVLVKNPTQQIKSYHPHDSLPLNDLFDLVPPEFVKLTDEEVEVMVPTRGKEVKRLRIRGGDFFSSLSKEGTILEVSKEGVHLVCPSMGLDFVLIPASQIERFDSSVIELGVRGCEGIRTLYRQLWEEMVYPAKFDLFRKLTPSLVYIVKRPATFVWNASYSQPVVVRLRVPLKLALLIRAGLVVPNVSISASDINKLMSSVPGNKVDVKVKVELIDRTGKEQIVFCEPAKVDAEIQRDERGSYFLVQELNLKDLFPQVVERLESWQWLVPQKPIAFKDIRTWTDESIEVKFVTGNVAPILERGPAWIGLMEPLKSDGKIAKREVYLAIVDDGEVRYLPLFRITYDSKGSVTNFHLKIPKFERKVDPKKESEVVLDLWEVVRQVLKNLKVSELHPKDVKFFKAWAKDLRSEKESSKSETGGEYLFFLGGIGSLRDLLSPLPVMALVAGGFLVSGLPWLSLVSFVVGMVLEWLWGASRGAEVSGFYYPDVSLPLIRKGLDPDLSQKIGEFVYRLYWRSPAVAGQCKLIIERSRSIEECMSELVLLLLNSTREGEAIATEVLLSWSDKIPDSLRERLVGIKGGKALSGVDLYYLLRETGLLGIVLALSGIDIEPILVGSSGFKYDRDAGSNLIYNLLTYDEKNEYWKRLGENLPFVTEYLRRTLRRKSRWLSRKVEYALYYLNELRFLVTGRLSRAFYSGLLLWRTHFYPQKKTITIKKRKSLPVGGILIK